MNASPTMRRIIGLLESAPDEPDLSHGYLNLLGNDASPSGGLGQRLMMSKTVPAIYERYWRPLLAAIATGFSGPSMAEEYELAAQWLALTPGSKVLDVACGPGNFTRAFAAAVGPSGLVVGMDASATMLGRAVAQTAESNVGYVRGDAMELPFHQESFDAVCCFAALHLFARPMAALDQMTRALVPGGRIAIMTSRRPGLPFGLTDRAFRRLGMTVFSDDSVSRALADRGCTGIRQRLAGAVQFVAATRSRR